MTIEFDNVVNKELNSISALAVEVSPVRVRLQKLVSIVCNVLQVSATRLLLRDEFLVLPELLIAGADKSLFQIIEEGNASIDLQVGKQLFKLEWPTADELSTPYCQTLTIHGQAHKVVVVPVVIGDKPLGALLLATTNPLNLIRESQALLRALAERVGLVLLVLKSSQALSSKQSLMHRDNWFTEEFLAVLSHELRAPLHAILGWVSVMQHPATNHETWANALKTIERSARAQSKIINDLLDASFCFNQQPDLHKRPVPVRSILRQVLNNLVPVAEQKGIVLTLDVRITNECVLADAERLRQAFWHLLSNAIKFTPVKGQIQLLAQRTGDHFELTLVDSGIGIAADFMPYIFDPFRQESAQTTRKFGGLGLGLTIARQQIELHGGDIEIVSAGKNQGATVVVRLPLHLPLPGNSETRGSLNNRSNRNHRADRVFTH